MGPPQMDLFIPLVLLLVRSQVGPIQLPHHYIYFSFFVELVILTERDEIMGIFEESSMRFLKSPRFGSEFTQVNTVPTKGLGQYAVEYPIPIGPNRVVYKYLHQ